MPTIYLYSTDESKTYIFHVIFMMKDVLKQCLQRQMLIIWQVRKNYFDKLLFRTLDKLGFWEYLARFSLDKFMKGPSGLVNIEAWGVKK